MDPGQDWCLQCGAGAPGSLGRRPELALGGGDLTAAAVLVLGAAAAGYAALNKEGAHKPPPTVVAVDDHSRRGDAHADAPVTPTPTTPGRRRPPRLRTPAAANPLCSTGTAKPPKIPLTAPHAESPEHYHHAHEHQQRIESTTAPPAAANESARREPRTNRSPARSCSTPTRPPPTTPTATRRATSATPAWRSTATPRPLDRSGRTRRWRRDGGGAADRSEQRRSSSSALELVTSTPGMTCRCTAPSQHLPELDHRPRLGAAQPSIWSRSKRHVRIKLRDPRTRSASSRCGSAGRRRLSRHAAGARPRERQRTGTVPGE